MSTLAEFGGTKARVGMHQVAEEAWQGSAKLHGLGGSQPDGFLIDTGVGVVNDKARPPVTLRDHTQG
jgi:hypothetical protein